jgi:hypothetical protein
MKKHLVFLSFLLILVTSTFAQHDHMASATNSNTSKSGINSADKPAFHGMLIIGKDVVYASHLPMFRIQTWGEVPHDYQVILKLKLDEASDKLFKKDQAEHPKTVLYTINPEAFILPDMIAKPRPFKAELYRNHFERKDSVRIATINITIEKVVLFKKFDPKAIQLKEAKYLVFGSGKERFMAHVISQRPDFDQVIQVQTDLAEGTEVSANQVQNKPLQATGKPIKVKVGQKEATMTSLKQLYLEINELK